MESSFFSISASFKRNQVDKHKLGKEGLKNYLEKSLNDERPTDSAKKNGNIHPGGSITPSSSSVASSSTSKALSNLSDSSSQCLTPCVVVSEDGVPSNVSDHIEDPRITQINGTITALCSINADWIPPECDNSKRD